MELVSESVEQVNDTEKQSEPRSASLAEVVFEFVVSNIMKGNYTQKKKLGQRTLAKQLNISHVPVREALEKLREHGWVDRIPKRGTFIKEFDAAGIKELYQTREIIEIGALRLTGNRLTHEQLRSMKHALDQMEAAIKSHDVEAHMKADTDFHRHIVHLAGLSRMEVFYESILLQTKSVFLVSALRAAYVWRVNTEDLEPFSHKHIHGALESRDVKKAIELLTRHIRVGPELAAMTLKYSKPLDVPY